jgi:hypothetical protein
MPVFFVILKRERQQVFVILKGATRPKDPPNKRAEKQK